MSQCPEFLQPLPDTVIKGAHTHAKEVVEASLAKLTELRASEARKSGKLLKATEELYTEANNDTFALAKTRMQAMITQARKRELEVSRKQFKLDTLPESTESTEWASLLPRRRLYKKEKSQSRENTPSPNRAPQAAPNSPRPGTSGRGARYSRRPQRGILRSRGRGRGNNNPRYYQNYQDYEPTYTQQRGYRAEVEVKRGQTTTATVTTFQKKNIASSRPFAHKKHPGALNQVLSLKDTPNLHKQCRCVHSIYIFISKGYSYPAQTMQMYI